MTDVVSVKFSSRGKAYFFDPNGNTVNTGDRVIVETSKGLDIGDAALGNHPVPDESLIPPLRPIIRVATDEDREIDRINKEREKEAFKICKEKISFHKLDMKLVSVECGFEGNKILFFFTADGRVDFRELVKDLASVFRTRIELRQIGVRDETKMLGGLGICGKPFCCSQFLNDFQPVSTKMAKTQSMSLNPTKISGSCGRLMCCLRYEQEAYEDLMKTIPKIGAFVQTTDGYGNVVQTNVLRQKVKVRIDSTGEPEVKVLDAAQVALVPGGRPKPGDPLPQVLNYVSKEEEPKEPEEDVWKAPTLFADNSGIHDAGGGKPFGNEPPRGEAPKPEARRRSRNRPKQNSGNKPAQPQKPNPQQKQNQPVGNKPAPKPQVKPLPQAGEAAQKGTADPKPHSSKPQNRNRRGGYTHQKPKPEGQK
ncbi:MAG: regulatory iron-sulfur-containing complex subunit RicT [Oscillospiraceae bacterium]